jgi:putative membrane protein
VAPDEVADATRRTRLANERTHLAWWRSGLTSFAVALGAGKVAPELGSGPRWPYAALGAGFAVLGIAFVAYGFQRRRAVDQALDRGEFASESPAVMAAVAVAGLLLGLGTLVLILAEV